MTTNREWLYSLDVADLADWFDSEHESTLDGDTDALERKSADLIYEYYKPMVAELQAKVDELTAERDKLRSQICKLEDDLVRANDENKRVSFADRIRFVDRIDELKTERDNLKANNEQLHMLAGEQAAKIDELQSAFDAICANLSIIATGEPNVIADIAIATIEALIDQCNEYRSKFGKCLDYADAIHALMDDEGMA